MPTMVQEVACTEGQWLTARPSHHPRHAETKADAGQLRRAGRRRADVIYLDRKSMAAPEGSEAMVVAEDDVNHFSWEGFYARPWEAVVEAVKVRVTHNRCNLSQESRYYTRNLGRHHHRRCRNHRYRSRCNTTALPSARYVRKRRE